MGNLFKTHNLLTDLFTCLLLVFISFVMGACEVKQPTLNDIWPAPQETQTNEATSQSGGGGGQPIQPVEERITAAVHCPDIRRDECGLLVKIFAEDTPINLNIRLRIDDGIIFRSDYIEAVTFEEDGLEGRIAQVSLISQESREILFPYQLNGPTLPGAYRVKVIATNAQTNEVFGYAETYVYVYLDDEGEFHLLSTKSDYDNHFLNGFVEGNFGVSYKILLEDKEQPHKGNILLGVTSDQENYAPTLELTSLGGINFVTDPTGQNLVLDFGMKVRRTFPQIDNGGARIASFPFIFEQNGQTLEGIYALILAIDPETNHEKKEQSPLAIRVVSDPNYREERWLSVARLEPKVLNTISNEPNEISGPSGGHNTLDAVAAQQLCETRWKKATFPPDTKKPAWNFYISDFNGTLCQLYAEKYAGKSFISWEEFSRLAVQMNDNISDANALLVDHEIYQMPRPNNVP